MAVYSNDEFVADKVFPNIAVDKRSDLYFKYNKDDFNRDTAQERAPGAESAGDGFSVSTDSYSAKVVALHHDIPDQNRANTDEPLNEDEDAAILLTHKLLLKREIDWASAFFTTGVWTGTTTGTDIVPGTKWDNASGTPIKDIKAQIIAQKKLHGFRPNTLVLGEEVWNALQESADFLARITGGSTKDNPAVVMPELLAQVLGIKRVLIAGAIKNTAVEGATASTSFIFGERALLCYCPDRPGKRIPSCGYTFAWKQYGAADMSIRMKRFRMEPRASDRVEGEIAYALKVVASDMGGLFDNVLT
jgi:hypothetical protein